MRAPIQIFQRQDRDWRFVQYGTDVQYGQGASETRGDRVRSWYPNSRLKYSLPSLSGPNKPFLTSLIFHDMGKSLNLRSLISADSDSRGLGPE